jgi:hypothetical protein
LRFQTFICPTFTVGLFQQSPSQYTSSLTFRTLQREFRRQKGKSTVVCTLAVLSFHTITDTYFLLFRLGIKPHFFNIFDFILSFHTITYTYFCFFGSVSNLAFSIFLIIFYCVYFHLHSSYICLYVIVASVVYCFRAKVLTGS